MISQHSVSEILTQSTRQFFHEKRKKESTGKYGDNLELGLAMILDSAQVTFDSYTDDTGIPLQLIKYKNE